MQKLNINSQVGEQVILEANGYGETTRYGTITSINNKYTHYCYGNMVLTQVVAKIEYDRVKRWVGGTDVTYFDNKTGEIVNF